jgi:soluble lytic murein transglycosylase-like protein
MPACERAADGLLPSGYLAMPPVRGTSVSQLSLAARQGVSFQAAVSVLRLVLSDVIEGGRWLSRHALAAVGLVAVLSLVFLATQGEVRHSLEAQALTWLTERAGLRADGGVGGSADGDILLAMAEPDAIQRATAANPAELNRQQSAVAFWIARRYSVAPEPISRLVQEAWAVGQRVGMEPTVVLAVMAVESGFNPFAQSHVGAQGLMQVMTRIHHDKYEIFGGQNAAFDPVTNLRVGVQVLQDCVRRAGSLAGGLKHYVGAANLPDDGGYATKVLAEAAYLRQVAGGQKVAFNAPLPQAAIVTPAPSTGAATAPAAASAESGPAGAARSADAASGPAAPAAPQRTLEHVAMLSPKEASR